MTTQLRPQLCDWPLVAFPTLKLTLHLLTLGGYGWFRDELYYVVCSQRLDWGYVDHPPLSLLVLRGWRTIFGDSLTAMRLLPALTGTLGVLVIGLLARRMGGGRLAQALAMGAALVAPAYLDAGHTYSMNSYSPLLWGAAGLLLVAIIQRGRPALWLALGVLLGLGLENKIDVLWLGAGLVVGLLLTRERRWLATPWPWLAGTLSLVLFAPYLLWQVHFGWPTLEFMRNATQVKMAPVGALDLTLAQLQTMGPFAAPLWIGGLIWLMASRAGRPYRLLGWIWLTVFALLVAMGASRASYLTPAFTLTLAAGGVAGERWLMARPRLGWAVAALVVAGGGLYLPFGLPVLPVPAYVAYARALRVAPSTAERKELGALPQHYADMHGWPELVRSVADSFRQLPPADRERAVVFAGNYGEASAVEVLGEPLGLPPAISGHNNYWLWGPRGSRGDLVLVIGGERDDLEESFASVEQGATILCGYCMPYENHQPVWIARGMRTPLEELWPRLKHYD